MIGRRDLSSLLPEEKKKLLDEILTRVQGIDINPLSVFTARVSYLLAIDPLLSGDPVEIPIYPGDSADVPDKIVADGVNCYQYIVSTKQGEINVTLPCSFVENGGFEAETDYVFPVIKKGQRGVRQPGGTYRKGRISGRLSDQK